MSKVSFKVSRWFSIGMGIAILASSCWAHVTFRPSQPLRPGGSATISMVVPTERSVDTVRVTLEIPEAFLRAGGRLSRVDFPAGWQVKIDKEDKPDEVYASEVDQRSKRNNATESAPEPAKTPAEQKEAQISSEMQRQWIKKVTFEAGSIPPYGFKVFSLDFQIPNVPGEYRFPAVQTYADGVDVSWSELVKGAQHPAPSLTIATARRSVDYQKLALPMSGLALLISFATLYAQIRRRAAGR